MWVCLLASIRIFCFLLDFQLPTPNPGPCVEWARARLICLQGFCSPHQALGSSLVLQGRRKQQGGQELDQKQGAMPSLSKTRCPLASVRARRLPSALTSWPRHDSHTSANEAGEGTAPKDPGASTREGSLLISPRFYSDWTLPHSICPLVDCAFLTFWEKRRKYTRL